MKSLDEITGAIVDESVKLHQRIGPGLLESVYEALLAKALRRRGFQVERQKRVVFEFDGEVFDEGLKIDLLVEGRVIVEIKSVETLAPVHGKQVLTYLRLTGLHVGLLINFGGATLKQGLRRIVNELAPSDSPGLDINKEPEVARGDAENAERTIPESPLEPSLQTMPENPFWAE
jgi:GxxExxY protein